MIIMPMREHDLGQRSEVNPQRPGILEEAAVLTGINQYAFLAGLKPETQPMLRLKPRFHGGILN
jgi:hypothetical protein